MPTAREDDHRWLLTWAAKEPDGWEAKMIAAFGMNGALDLLSAQRGDGHNVNLTHRPFVGNEKLKQLVRNVREAQTALSTAAFETWWERLHEIAEQEASDGEER